MIKLKNNINKRLKVRRANRPLHLTRAVWPQHPTGSIAGLFIGRLFKLQVKGRMHPIMHEEGEERVSGWALKTQTHTPGRH